MIDSMRPLLLGSSSPRRRDLLERLGIPLSVATAEVDETMLADEDAGSYLERITADKLAAVARIGRADRCGALLVADTSVVLEDRVLGKPRDDHDGRAMIRSLAGREHEVRTRFAIASPADLSLAVRRGVERGTPVEPYYRQRRRPTADGRWLCVHAETVVTRVVFRSLDDREIDAYVATGEGRDKAGSYAIQGVGGFAVRRIEGSYTNVVGLPICEVVEALQKAGLLVGFPGPLGEPSIPGASR